MTYLYKYTAEGRFMIDCFKGFGGAITELLKHGIGIV